MDDDLISRKEAIVALAGMHCKSDEDGYVWIIRKDAWSKIDALPSAQPEIIRCKDCKHRYTDGKNVVFNVCELNHNKVQSDDWYCADAERRTDGTD